LDYFYEIIHNWKNDDENNFYMSITGNPIRHAKFMEYLHPGVTAQNPKIG
jgi:hypothetical protein